jgi:hypothetical protein
VLRPEGPAGDRYLQRPDVRVREAMRRAKAAGHFVMAFTAAPWGDYRLTKLWLDEHGFPVDVLICGKPNYDCFYDDRTVNSLSAFEEFLDAH